MADDMATRPDASGASLIDRFGRHITYLRLSVTDRCNLRCTYCMAEQMQFLPRKDLLTLEELQRVTSAFIDRGVTKVRITGGEPLVRKDILSLFAQLGQRLGQGLEELTLTTNAVRLAEYAPALYAAGVRRVNVSLDSLDPERFARITRRGDLAQVLDGIAAAKAEGLHVKINTVALKTDNATEIPDMVAWAHSHGHDMSLIEVMPLGDTGEDRFDQYIPLPEIRARLEARWQLEDMPVQTGLAAGPARYVRIAQTGGRLGFITPLTQNFCAGCNRVRVTCTGRIYMCLGQGDHVDLREKLRAHPDDDTPLHLALEHAMLYKPEKHDFAITQRGQASALARHMSMTGG